LVHRPEIKRAGFAKEIDSGLRYQDPLTGRWIRRVRTGVADNMIFNPKPGSALGPDSCRQHRRINSRKAINLRQSRD